MELSPQLTHHKPNIAISVHEIRDGKFAYKNKKASNIISRHHKIGNSKEPSSVYSIGLKTPPNPVSMKVIRRMTAGQNHAIRK